MPGISTGKTILAIKNYNKSPKGGGGANFLHSHTFLNHIFIDSAAYPTITSISNMTILPRKMTIRRLRRTNSPTKSRSPTSRCSTQVRDLTLMHCIQRSHTVSSFIIHIYRFIRSFLHFHVGKNCPFLKGKRTPVSYAFSLQLVSEPSELDFIAPDDKVFDVWTDGINALLEQPLTSKTAIENLEMLLDMQIRIQMLDLEGIVIPDAPPPIPDDPPDYDFLPTMCTD